MASTVIVKLWTTVKDNVGRYAKTAVQIALANWDPAGTVAAAWKVILENLIGTNGTIVKQSTASSHALSGVAIAGARGNREDKVTADLLDANGVTHTFRIPTPSVSLAMSAGSDQLDLSNSALLAWVAQMQAHAVTPDGVAFTGVCTGGRFIRHKKEKKGGY